MAFRNSSFWSLGNSCYLLRVGFAQGSTLAVRPSGCDYASIQTAVYAALELLMLGLFWHQLQRNTENI
jgi:hypothetical protein